MSSIQKVPIVQPTRKKKKKQMSYSEREERMIANAALKQDKKPKEEEKKEIRILPIRKPLTRYEIFMKFYNDSRKLNCDDRTDLQTLSPTQKITMYEWNINGLRNIMDSDGVNEFKNFMNRGSYNRN